QRHLGHSWNDRLVPRLERVAPTAANAGATDLDCADGGDAGVPWARRYLTRCPARRRRKQALVRHRRAATSRRLTPDTRSNKQKTRTAGLPFGSCFLFLASCFLYHFRPFPHAQPVAHLAERLGVSRVRGVQVLALRDQLEFVVTRDAGVQQHACE